MVRTAFLSAFALTLHGAAAAADTEALQPKPLSPHAIAIAKHKADLAMCNGHDVCKVVQCEAGYTRTPFCPTHGKQAGVKECRCHAEVALSGQLEVAVPAAQKGAAKLDSQPGVAADDLRASTGLGRPCRDAPPAAAVVTPPSAPRAGACAAGPSAPNGSPRCVTRSFM